VREVGAGKVGAGNGKANICILTNSVTSTPVFGASHPTSVIMRVSSSVTVLCSFVALAAAYRGRGGADRTCQVGVKHEGPSTGVIRDIGNGKKALLQ